MKSKALLLFAMSFKTECNRKRILRNKKKSKKIHRLFFNKILSTINESRKLTGFDLIIYTDLPINVNQKLNKDAKSKNVIIKEQTGNNFSERFINSIKNVFELGYEQVVTVGNDIPDISSEIITNSFIKLESENSVVLGPSVDGGFYLLGLNKFDSNLFKDIEWQTGSEFKQLCKNIHLAGNQIIFEPVLADIDNTKDLFNWILNKSDFSITLKKLFLAFNECINFTKTIKDTFQSQEYFSKRLSQKSPPPVFYLL